jgi:UDP-glucose 4-epimerase
LAQGLALTRARSDESTMSEAQSKLLITGASGFIGRRLAAQAAARGWPQRLAARRAVHPVPAERGIEVAPVGEIDGGTDWTEALRDVGVIIHCAARVHVLREQSGDPLAEYRRVNVEGTLNLARQAARARVRRLVFLSSIGVNGGETLDRPFDPSDPPAPESPYAQSKLEAECGLHQVSGETGLEVVVLRAPLVYGAHARGNWETLVRWVSAGVPLPLGAIHNRRSLVGLDNLVDLLLVCARHAAAANQTFLVADGEDLSTTELIRALACALGRRPRLIPVPQTWIRFAARATGKTAAARKIIGSLQVDASRTRKILEWSPPLTVAEGLAQVAQACRS